MSNPNVTTTVERLERETEVVLVEKTIADRKEVLGDAYSDDAW